MLLYKLIHPNRSNFSHICRSGCSCGETKMTDAVNDDSGAQEAEFSSDDGEAEEEELEYSVQFAGRLPSNELEQTEDGDPETTTSSGLKRFDEVQSVVKEKEPVVFLIGWADCMDRYCTVEGALSAHYELCNDTSCEGKIRSVIVKPNINQRVFP